MLFIFVASEATDLILKIAISMMYPKGPQLYTQVVLELAGGVGGGGISVGWSELLQDDELFLKTNYAVWMLVVPNVPSSVYKSTSVLGTSP